MPNAEKFIQDDMAQQDTGNHKAPGAPDAGGADKFGGTRAGAGNVEHSGAKPTASVKGSDVDRVAGLDESISVNGPAERAPERDEHGRL